MSSLLRFDEIDGNRRSTGVESFASDYSTFGTDMMGALASSTGASAFRTAGGGPAALLTSPSDPPSSAATLVPAKSATPDPSTTPTPSS